MFRSNAGLGVVYRCFNDFNDASDNTGWSRSVRERWKSFFLNCKLDEPSSLSRGGDSACEEAMSGPASAPARAEPKCWLRGETVVWGNFSLGVSFVCDAGAGSGCRTAAGAVVVSATAEECMGSGAKRTLAPKTAFGLPLWAGPAGRGGVG